jgi:uncharacterized protein YhaN
MRTKTAGLAIFSPRKTKQRTGFPQSAAMAPAIDAKRRTTLLTIEDKAVAYLKLRLGAAAADNALRAYRKRCAAHTLA